MREYIIADNQDITKAGMMFLLSKQKDVSLLLTADNKAELIRELRLHPQAVVILDYTLFDFAGADELIVLRERFKEVDWLLFSDELSIGFLRQILFSSMAFGVVLKKKYSLPCNVLRAKNVSSATMSAICYFRVITSNPLPVLTHRKIIC